MGKKQAPKAIEEPKKEGPLDHLSEIQQKALANAKALKAIFEPGKYPVTLFKSREETCIVSTPLEEAEAFKAGWKKWDDINQ